MFPINFNFPFRKKDGSISTIGDEINSGGGGGGYELPTASAETKGGIKIGSGLSMSGEVLNNSNPTPYSLPTASAETLGGVKVGSGLSIEDGVLSASSSGGAKLYSKSFGNLGTGQAAGASNMYYLEYPNIDVSGYTPISCAAEYTGYTPIPEYFMSSIQRYDDVNIGRVLFKKSSNITDANTMYLKVYYVKNDETPITPLT